MRATTAPFDVRSLAIVAALAATRCTGATPPSTPGDVPRATPCTAGMTVACPCASGGQGIQTCDPVTGVFSACACAPSDGGVDGASADRGDATPGDAPAPLDVPVSVDGMSPLDVAPPLDASADAPAPLDAAAPPDAQPRDASGEVGSDVVSGEVATPDRPPTDAPSGPQTLVYAITGWSVDTGAGGAAPDPRTDAQGAAGFNLDGRFSGAVGAGAADCAHGDFFSVVDPDQNMGSCAFGMARGGPSCQGGVDNQLPEMANIFSGFGSDLRMTLNDDVRTGRSAVLLRVTGVDGAPGPSLDDPAVRVFVYPVARPTFTSCSSIGTPGLSYAVDDASLTTPGDLESARLSFTGRIVRGRLLVDPPADASRAVLPLSISAPAPMTFALQAAQVRFSMGPDRATDGNLGGYVPLPSLVAQVRAALPAGIPEATIVTVLSSLIDVQLPAGSPTGCTAPNGAVSMGLAFIAARATIAPTTVTAALPGACGGPAAPMPGGCYIESADAPRCPSAAVAHTDPSRPSYRVTHVRVSAPAALTAAILQNVLNDALRRGNFLWGLSLDVAGRTLRSGALNAARLTRGTVGQGLLDGTFRYFTGDAPGGPATRWDAATTALTGTSASASSGTLSLLRLPIFEDAGGLLTELPLRDLRFTAIRSVPGGRCVGLGLVTSGRFNECTSTWQTAEGASPYGLVEGVITATDARGVRVASLGTTLCNLLAGSDCDTVPQALWTRPPDATVGGAPGWRFSAEYAAVSARTP